MIPRVLDAVGLLAGFAIMPFIRPVVEVVVSFAISSDEW